MADAFLMQAEPVETLAGVHFAGWGHIGMGQHTFGRNGVAGDDIARECNHRIHLRGWEINIAKLMAGIVDFNANGS